eukprot:8108360-Ditylum_brightwellii.AAC.1
MADTVRNTSSPKCACFNKEELETVIQGTKPTTAFIVATPYLKSQTVLLHPETATIIKHFLTGLLKLQSFILRKEQ